MTFNLTLNADAPSDRRVDTRYTFMRVLLVVCLVFCSLLSRAEEDFLIPDGYVLQRLDPTDGRIAKPKDWFYASSGTQNGWLWTLSAEDPSKGGYETGLRIQLFVGVEKATKRSTEIFAQNFLQQKRNSTKVVGECPVIDQGQFKRQCIEVIENIQRPERLAPVHILYSVFWGTKLDMVVVNTFGAPEGKWQSVADASKVMAKAEIIGLNFGKQK